MAKLGDIVDINRIKERQTSSSSQKLTVGQAAANWRQSASSADVTKPYAPVVTKPYAPVTAKPAAPIPTTTQKQYTTPVVDKWQRNPVISVNTTPSAPATKKQYTTPVVDKWQRNPVTSVNTTPSAEIQNRLKAAQASNTTNISRNADLLTVARAYDADANRYGAMASTAAERARNMGSAYKNSMLGSAINAGGMLVNLPGSINTGARHTQWSDEDRQAQANIERYMEMLKTAKTDEERKRIEGWIRSNTNKLKLHQEQIANEAKIFDDAAAPIYQKADQYQNKANAATMRAKEGLGTVGSMLVDAGISSAQSLTDAAIGMATGTGMLPFAARAFGGGGLEARQNGASSDQALLYGAADAAKEVLTEKMFNVALPYKKAYGAGWGKGLEGFLEESINKAVARIPNEMAAKVTGTLMQAGESFLTEGLEELVGDAMEYWFQLRKLYGGDPMTRDEVLENMVTDFIVGGLSGLIGSGEGMLMNTVKTGSPNTYDIAEWEKRRNPTTEAAQTAGPVIESWDDVYRMEAEQAAAPQAAPAAQTEQNRTLMQAALEMNAEGRVTNSSAERILADRDAMDELGVTATGIKSKDRAAVKEALTNYVMERQNQQTAAEQTAAEQTAPAEAAAQRMENADEEKQQTAQTDRAITPAERQTVANRAADTLGENGARWFKTAYNPDVASRVEPATAFAGFSAVYDSIYEKRSLTEAEKMAVAAIPQTMVEAAKNAANEDSARVSQAKYFGKAAGFDRAASAAVLKKANLSSKDIRTMDAVGKVVGARVLLVENLKDGNGESVYASYDNGVIRISAEARNPVRTLFTHELVHRIRETSPQAYSAMASFVQDNMEMLGNIAEDIYGKTYDTGDTSAVTEEMVADAFGTVLENSDVLDRFAYEHRSAAQKLMDAVHDLVAAIKRALNGQNVQIDSQQRMLFSELMDRATEMEILLGNALEQAGEAKDAQSILDDGGTVTTESGADVASSDGNGHTQFSKRTYREEGRAILEKYLQNKVKAGELKPADMEDMLAQMDEIDRITDQFTGKFGVFGAWSEAEVIRDSKGRPVFSVVKANGDYKMNLDFSLVCKKRRTLDAVFNELIKRGVLENFDMKERSIVAINDMIREEGFETACALCFVDSKRFRQGMVADSFVSLYNNLVRSMAPAGAAIDHFNYGSNGLVQNTGTGIDTMQDAELDFTEINKTIREYGAKTVEHKVAKFLKNHPDQRKLLLRGDFMSTAGFDAVKIQNNDLLKLYNAKKGAGGPKASQSDVQYLNEILSSRTFSRDRAYSVGGVRIQSFSDYMPRLVFDYAQMVADLAAKKLPAHAYSKEASFVKQFGKTGIKINMSLVPDVVKGGVAPGLDADGNYVWRDGQSFGSDVNKKGSGADGYKLAIEIQKADVYTKNCGTIAVGISDQQIIKMLGDPNIRMVIPYHKSSLNHIVAVMNNIGEFTNYTDFQNTKGADGNNLPKGAKDFNFNDALRRTGDAKTAANEYLAWCAEKGYHPKFEQFAWHENYYKLLEDFACYDEAGNATPQGDVTLTFPGKDDAFGSMEKLIEQGLEEDAVLQGRQDKQVPHIADRIEAELGKMEAEWNAEDAANKSGVKHSRGLSSVNEYFAQYLEGMADLSTGKQIGQKEANEFKDIAAFLRNAEKADRKTAAEMQDRIRQMAKEKRLSVAEATLAGQMAAGRELAPALRRAEEALAREKAKREREILMRRDQRETRLWKKAESEARTKLLEVARRLSGMKTTAANRAVINAAIGDLDLVSKSITGKTLQNLRELQDWYNDQRMNNPDFVADPTIEKKLQRLSKKQIADMDMQDVLELTDVLKHIENAIRTADELIESEVKKKTFDAAGEIVKDISAVRGSKKTLGDWIANNTLSPERLIHRMVGYKDSNPLMTLTKELSKGQRMMMNYQMRAENLFSKWANDAKFIDSIRGKKAGTLSITGYNASTGKTESVKINRDMLMALYLHSLNDQNITHASEGGLTIPDLDLLNKGQVQEAYARGTTIKVSPSEMRKFVGFLTTQELAYAQATSKYFNGMSREEINAVSEQLVGYSLAGVENYFPINTDSNFTKKEFESLKMDGTLEGMGFLKERQNAANPIMLRGMTDVLNQSIKMNSKYVGLAIPVRNFSKVWNTSMARFNEDGTVDRYAQSVQQAVTKAWGTSGAGYIEKMMTDLQNGGGHVGDMDKLFRKLRSNYAGAVLTLNLGVAAKQAASYPTAAAVVGWTPLAKALADNSKADTKLIAKYTPLLWYRSKGFSNQELGDLASRGKHIPKFLNWIQAMDVATTTKLWKAAEYYVQDNMGLTKGGDTYYRAVADVYNRIIEETQPNYTTMQRPQLLRSDSFVDQSISMFKTQPFQNFNILYDAIGNLAAKTRDGTKAEINAARLEVSHAVSSQVVQAAVFSAITMAWNMLRLKPDKYKDEDGELTIWSILRALGLDMVSSGASMVPFGSDALELGRSVFLGEAYYGMDTVSINALSDVFDSVVKASNNTRDLMDAIGSGEKIDTRKLAKQTNDLGVAVAQAFGIPANNVENLMSTIYRRIANGMKGKYLGDYTYLTLIAAADSKKYDVLYQAYLHDKDQYEAIRKAMIEDGKDDDALDGAIESRAKKNSAYTIAQQETYTQQAAKLERARGYNRLSDDYRKAAADILESYSKADALAGVASTYTLTGQNEKIAKAEKFGVEPWQYALYKAALKMADANNPNPKKRNKRYDSNEKDTAINMVDGLTQARRNKLKKM